MDENILKVLENFFDEMGYTRNNHVLGVFSYVTESEKDIGLIVVSNGKNDRHIYKGLRTIDDIKIKYYEAPIDDLYLTVERKLEEQNNDYLYLIGSAKILFDTDDSLKKLQEVTNEVYKKPMPVLDMGETYETLVNLSEMIKVLKNFAEENRPDFNSLYYLTLEEIRVFYHKIMGYPSINATEATKVYTNKMYRQKYFKDDIPEQPFTKAYLRALNDMTVTKTAEDKREKLEKLEYVFYLAKQGLNLIESDYRIPVRTRNR